MLIVLTVLGLIVGIAGLILPERTSYGDGSTQSSREAAISATNDFAVAYNTYDAAKLDDYQQRVGSLLTKDYRKEFIKVTDSIFKVLKTKKQKSGDANVLQIAVDSMDADSGELLVAVDAKLSNTDNDKKVTRKFRWQVSVVKSGDDWKIDNFESISALQAEQPKSEQPKPEQPKSDSGADKK